MKGKWHRGTPKKEGKYFIKEKDKDGKIFCHFDRLCSDGYWLRTPKNKVISYISLEELDEASN